MNKFLATENEVLLFQMTRYSTCRLIVIIVVTSILSSSMYIKKNAKFEFPALTAKQFSWSN